MDGERADVAAGKLERLDGKAVGGDHDVAVHMRQRDGIGVGIEQRVAEMAGKDVGNEFAHEAAAVAVCEKDAGVVHGFLCMKKFDDLAEA